MADELESVASPGLETATPTAPEPREEPRNDNLPEVEASEEVSGADIPPPEDDDEEYDLDGKKFRAPKTLKERMLMHADYTRKTQEAAAIRRELEQQREAVAQQAQQSDEEIQARGQLWQVNQQLEQYAQVNWEAWEQQDPIDAQRGWRTYQQLKEASAKAESFISQRANERTQTAQRETATRIEQTREYAQKNIKGWTPEIDAKITQYAASRFTPEQLRAAINPEVYQLLYEGWVGKQALTKQPASTTPKPAPAPLQTVQARQAPAARKSYADMSMEEYVAARKAGRG